MIVYHFLSAQYGLDDIRKRRLKVSTLDKLNDPFEFLCVNLADKDHRRSLVATRRRLSKETGLVCFSGSWQNPVQWSHYADRHRGVCLGLSIPDAVLHQVSYVQSRPAWPAEPDERFTGMLLSTKYAHWSYEDEFRFFCRLEHPDGDNYFVPFEKHMELAQVIVGANSNVTRAEVSEALASANLTAETFKVRPSFNHFKMVRQMNSKLWL